VATESTRDAKVEEPKKKRGFWGRIFGRGEEENERKKEEERKEEERKKDEERRKAGARPPGGQRP
jgi:hypothetical protein